MLKKITTLLGTGALGLSLATAHAGAIDTLKQFNDSAQGMSGQFSQVVTNKKSTKRSSGQFQILRPNLFKWTYNKPYQQVIVGDGKTIWLHDVDLAQVTKTKQNTALGDSPAAILSNKGSLDSQYTLLEDGNEGGIEYVKATPKNPDGSYQFIRLGFKGRELNQMQLKDNFGNETKLTFSGLKTDAKLSPSSFKFTPPKGVDVLEN
ncbi:MAG: outer membrane lipoprotein chaperone LolA [Neisseriaceae bacterium]|nr:outer membrane lipoprotein chaperone LolA [Neisseriaceae bacterium]MBP6860830.1 outer membrane lipoprotein chaperone LolA [Neisseriaceae bacterium]